MQRLTFASVIRFSRVLALSLLIVMLGGLCKPEAAVQPVSFGPKTDFGTGSGPDSVAVGDFNGELYRPNGGSKYHLRVHARSLALLSERFSDPSADGGLPCPCI